MALSSPGIGSNIDVSAIVSKLMSVESQPLTLLARKEASYQAKLSAFGTLSGALSSMQNSLSNLNNLSRFRTYGATVGDNSVLAATAGSNAAAGTYNINVTQLARGQSLMAAGLASSSASIGSGSATTLNFDFGTIGFAPQGTVLDAAVVTGGIAAGSLSINGSVIVTDAQTRSAKALATQINLARSTTGVTASASTSTGPLAFSDVSTGAGDSYSLSVAGVSIASLGAQASLNAGDIDSALASGPVQSALAAKGITASGSAAGGTLAFAAADGSNIDIAQTLVNGSGTASGGFSGIQSGVTRTWTGSVALASDKAITIGGTAPGLAGFSAGESKLENGIYANGAFTVNASRASAQISIGSNNNTLQGIRDAINAANIGVSASIISDGSSTPYRLVINSSKTGAASSMRLRVDGDAALQDLLSYDPAGTQKLTQTGEARNTLLSVNGIDIISQTQTVPEAIQGTTLTVSKVGSTTLNVARSSTTLTANLNEFVTSYNNLQKTISSLTSYNETTKVAGSLNGDASARMIQNRVRAVLGEPLTGTGGALSTLSQLGISIAKDGVMSLDNARLQKAVNENFDDIPSVFTSVGRPSDSLITYSNAGANTRAGTYALTVTRHATQGSLAGAVDLGSAPTIIAADTRLAVTLDGNKEEVSLPQGTYSAAELATALQLAINGNSKFSSAGSAVTASVEAGMLKLVSNRYGSASGIGIASASGTPAAALLGSASATAGLDVQGTLGGVAASGSGRYLTGAAGSDAEGLKLEVTGGSLGARGNVAFSVGYAATLDKLIGKLVGSNGSIAATTAGINASISDIGKRRTALNARLAQTEKRYLAQFNALDVSISRMNSTATYLTQQLDLIARQSQA